MCNVPVATRHASFPFTCFECRREEESDVKAEENPPKRKGKNERDDEEEFYRIPIAGERESDYDETLSNVLGNLSDSDNEWINKYDGEDTEASNNIAFAIGPRVPGRVMEKSITRLTHYNHTNSYAVLLNEELESDHLSPTEFPTWSAVLLQYQRACLKQRYKRPKKKRMKLMKEIRRKVPKVDPIPTRQSSQKVSDEECDKQALPFLQMAQPVDYYVPLPRTWLEFQTQSLQYQGHPIWNLCSPKEYYEWTKDWDWSPDKGHQPTAAMKKREWDNHRADADFIRHSELYPVPQLDLMEAYLSSEMTIPIRQCMNSISRKNPIRRTRETKATSHKDSSFPKRKTKWPKSWTQPLSPIIIPGTPDSSLDTASPPKDEIGKEDYESDDSVALFYQAYHKYKPEIDESNAESAARTELINQEIERLTRLRKQSKHQQCEKYNAGSICSYVYISICMLIHSMH